MSLDGFRKVFMSQRIKLAVAIILSIALPLAFQAYMQHVAFSNSIGAMSDGAFYASLIGGYACLALVSKRFLLIAVLYLPIMLVVSTVWQYVLANKFYGAP